jgi:hypothetical protein
MPLRFIGATRLRGVGAAEAANDRIGEASAIRGFRRSYRLGGALPGAHEQGAP